MLKYVDALVTFSEIPDEITLCINISNCPCYCKGCHSSYLAEDVGEKLMMSTLLHLCDFNKGITCVAFMGGDISPSDINFLAKVIKLNKPELKVAWYSGRQELAKDIDLENFDYIKLGPYIEDLGPLNSNTTNQRMYKVVLDHYDDGTSGYELEDITYKFWK
ncbi:hypothetical protein [Intestinibacter sp.]|uniref:hypothetical protein n=1 Tax=Intestinibacter sp. TaxID=1965304 RepID=UPI003F18603A